MRKPGAGGRRHVYIALNKPVGITCTTEHEVGGNIADFVDHAQRIFPIGRLDKESESLILPTSNGDIVNCRTAPTGDAGQAGARRPASKRALPMAASDSVHLPPAALRGQGVDGAYCASVHISPWCAMIRRVSCLLLAGLLVPMPALAQWSPDPSANLPIADRADGQVQPKIMSLPDGGFYVSWFDVGSGYDVHLQRLSADGVEQWSHNGVQLADRAFSSTQDYGLDVDANGDAVLAYRQEVAGIAQIAASRVDAGGTPSWGTPGVIVSNDAEDANSPRIGATGDGDVVVGWSAGDGTLKLQRLDADGAPVWVSPVVLTPASGGYYLSDIHGSGDGGAIVSWVAFHSVMDRQLWVQKFDADGAPQWNGGTPVAVFDGTDGAIQFGDFPGFEPDGSGGAVFVWYTVSVAGTARAQHVLADGSLAFAQNGVVLSTDATQTHTAPAGAWDAANGDIYAAWRVADASTQSIIGLNAQRIDATGARQWGDTGKVLVAPGSTDVSAPVALAAAGSGLFAWATGAWPSAMPIDVARVDAAGAHAWPTQTVAIKTGPTDSARLAGAIGGDGSFAAFVWQDGTQGVGEGDILGQAITLDGELGSGTPNDVIFVDGFDG